jgi:hypothetical protein
MSNLALRLFLALLTMASLGHVGVLFPRFLTISEGLPARLKLVAWCILLTVLTAVGACVLALVLVARSWEVRGARSLALFLAFLAAVWGSLLRFLKVEVLESEANVNLSASGWEATLAVAGLLLASGAFVRFSTLFPVPLSPDGLSPPQRLVMLRRLRVALFRPSVVWGLVALLVLAHPGLGLLFEGMIPSAPEGEGTPVEGAVVPFLIGQVVLICIPPLVAIGLGIRNLASGYGLATLEDRKRVLWLVAGTSAAGWMVLGSIFGFILAVALGLPEWIPVGLLVLLVSAPTVLVIACAIALFYAGSVDPGLVLKRSTVYGALGALGIVLFAGLEEVLSEWVASRMGLPGMVGSLLAGSLTAGIMIPLRKTVGRAASRILPGQGEASHGGPTFQGE